MPPPGNVERPPPSKVDAPPPGSVDRPPPGRVERPPPCDVDRLRGHVYDSVIPIGPCHPRDLSSMEFAALTLLALRALFCREAFGSVRAFRFRASGCAAGFAGDGTMLREWEEEPDEMSDESENERVALFWASASDAASTWMPTSPVLIPHGAPQQHFTLSVSTHGC